MHSSFLSMFIKRSVYDKNVIATNGINANKISTLISRQNCSKKSTSNKFRQGLFRQQPKKVFTF